MTQREAFMWIAEKHLFTPYVFGGDDPWGIDCSGLVISSGISCGLFPWGFDSTANGLLNRMKSDGKLIHESELTEGCLVFFGNPATHVEIIWKRPDLAIGASGGGSSHKAKGTDEAADLAAKTNAYVKIVPWARRPGPYACADPFLGTGGIA